MTHALLAAAVTALALCTFLVVYAMASAASGDPVRLGLRGLKRHRALAENGAWAALEPFVRWLGRRLSGVLSEGLVASLDLQMARAGDILGLLPEEFVALSLLGGVAGGAVGAVTTQLVKGSRLVLLMCVALGLVLPLVRLSSTTADRQLSITRRLPSAIDLLALAMSAGLDFPSAVRQIVEKAAATDPLVEEFSLILQSLKVGRTRRQALEEFAHRVPCRAVIDFTGAVVQAELRGTPVANVLSLQAETGRIQRTVRAEEAASKAGVKLVVPLALVFLCVLLVIVAPMIIRLRGT